MAFERHEYDVSYTQCIGAANLGHADCQNAIGYLLRLGFGINKDPVEARRWFQLAATKNNAAAQFNLALMLSSGEGGAQDYQESAKWLLKSAENGNVKAQANMGTVYAQGWGVETDQEKAVYWWRKAAEQGNPMAQNNFGWALLNGEGVIANAAAGRLWLEKAAGQVGDAEAHELARKNLLTLQRQEPASRNMPRNDFALLVEFSKPDAEGRTKIVIHTRDGSGLRSLKVSGKELGGSSDGRYSFVRYVPIGVTHIDVVGISESGERIAKSYSIERDNLTAGQFALPELDPSKIMESPKRDAVAIIIGAEQYESLPMAEFADQDARSFYDYAVKALGIPSKKVMVLSGQKARRNDILQATRNWLAAEVNDNRTEVFVFYSGHGLASPEGKKRYLLPIDTKVDLLEDTAISQDQLLKIIQAAHPRAITMLMDSCYSGVSRTGSTLLASARPIAMYAEAEALPANTTILSSSSGSQLSVSSPEVGHGLFSYFVMKGLEGEADQNGDRRITVEELYAYVSERVSKEAMRRGTQQTPTLSGVANRILTVAR